MEYLNRFAVALFTSLAEAAPWVVIGYLLVAMIREYVPRELLARHLGGGGLRPVLNALGIGGVLPLCSCGTIPLGVGLVRSGAAPGTALTLMTSGPAISPVALIVGYTLLGGPMLAAYALTVVAGAVVIGLIANRWLRVESTGRMVEDCDDTCTESGTQSDEFAARGPSRLRRAVRWALWDLGADVNIDLLIGLTAAAAIVAFLPRAWITDWLGQGDIWALLGIIVVAIPVYTCTVPSMIVVKSLLLMGASPGTAVAFLVAGPATNLGEINAIRGALGRRTAAYYVVSLVLLALAGGMIVNRLLPAGTLGANMGQPATTSPNALTELSIHADWRETAAAVPLWHYPFMVALAVVLVLGTIRRFGRKKGGTRPTAIETPQ